MKVLVNKDPRYHIDLRRVRQEVAAILAEMGYEDGEVGVIFVGRRKAKRLNQDYRQMDYIPAVLSFGQGGDKRGGRRLLGDVMICWPEVREQAIRENAPLEDVLRELLRHGLGNLVAELKG